MKSHFLILMLTLFMAACSGSGSGSAGGPGNGLPPDLPPTCKSIYNVWNAVGGNLERHDFSMFQYGDIFDYQYRAHDGLTCGYAANPNHNVYARLIPGNQTGFLLPDFILTMDYSLPIGAACDRYKSGTNHIAFIDMSVCDEIRICVDPNLMNCTTFR